MTEAKITYKCQPFRNSIASNDFRNETVIQRLFKEITNLSSNYPIKQRIWRTMEYILKIKFNKRNVIKFFPHWGKMHRGRTLHSHFQAIFPWAEVCPLTE